MKVFSETFRGALREDRQLNAIISYKADKAFYVLTTQDDKDLLTENDDVLITQQGFLEYDKETINSVNPLFNTSLFNTTCKSIQIDSINKINKKTWINVKIGVYKEDTQNYEYLDFGNYYVNEEPIYQADTNSYLITAYDKMIESMVSYDDNPLSITFPIKHKNFVIAICNKFDWEYDLNEYPNYNKNIVQDFYKGQNLTYRDILDDLNGACGGSFMFNLEDKLTWKRPEKTFKIKKENGKNEIYLENVLKGNAIKFKIDGKSTQETRSGKNLFNIENKKSITTYEKIINQSIPAGTYHLTASSIISNSTKFVTSLITFRSNGEQIAQTYIGGTQPLDRLIDLNKKCDEIYLYANSYYNNSVNVTTTFSDLMISTDGGEYEPYGVMPSPDYPSEIKNIDGIRNLFNKNGDFNFGNTRYQTTLEENGTIKSIANYGAGRSAGQKITVKKNTDYNLSGILILATGTRDTNVVVEIMGYENNTSKIIGRLIISKDVIKPYNFSLKFNSGTYEEIWISLNGWNSTTTGTTETIFDNLILTEGIKTHSYVPYGSNYLPIVNTGDNLSKTTLIDLKGNELCSIEEVKDELIIKDGKAKINKKIGKIVLNGSETYSYINNYDSGNIYRFMLSSVNHKINTFVLCDKFKNDNIYDTQNENIYVHPTQTKNIAFFIKGSRLNDISTNSKALESFKSWLSTHNTTVYYELAEPYEVDLGDYNIELFDGVNNISLESEIETNIEIEYKENYEIIIEDNDLKDVNVDFAEKYGKVNVLTITTNGNVVLDSKEDKQSIQENGRNEFNINDNYILNYSTDDFIDEIFNEINGLEYYLYDVDSTGLLIFEPLDMFTFRHNNIDYKTIMFNDDIKLTQGLVETTFAEKPEEEKKDYKTTDKDKNKLNNALISIDKANAEIQLKANKADVEASLELKVSTDDNNQVVSMINASANEINLKSNRLAVDSDNFKLTKEGNMTCSNANITGGNIELYGTDQFPSFKIYNPNNNQEYTEISSNSIKMWKNGEIASFLFGQAGNFVLHGSDDEYSTIITPSWFLMQSTIGDISEQKISLDAITGEIKCVFLTQTSLKENKNNFEKYDGALEEIKNIDIYKYNLKNEEDGSKKHLGFVIGDDFNYSEVVTSGDNKGVDNYSFTSLCLQAIKEQQVEIEDLKNQIKELKEMIKNG